MAVTTKGEKRRALVTMAEIEDYVRRNKKTIREWVEKENFPAVNIDGRWESHPDLIDEWSRRRIATMTGNADMIGGGRGG